MVKTKEEQTTKERNTQRRKRKSGWFHKGYLLWKLCDFEVAAYARNPDTGQIYTFRSDERIWFPGCMEDIELANPKPENMLPEDFEHPRNRRDPMPKSKSNPKPNKGGTRNARNRRTAVQKGKVAKYTCFLPEPPSFRLPSPPSLSFAPWGEEEEGPTNSNVLGLDEFDHGEMAFLEELDLNVIL